MQAPNQFNQFMTAGPMNQFPGQNPAMMGNFQMNPQFQQFNTQQFPNPQMQFQGVPGQMPQGAPGNFPMNAPQGGPGGPGPNMQQNMGPPPKQRLIVRLENNERGFYSTQLSQVDPEELGKMDGKQLAPFFKRSGLPVDMLKKIWLLASSDTKTMDKEDFYVALRLIAYAQNNVEVSAQSILQNLKAPLPKFQPAPKKVDTPTEIPAPRQSDVSLVDTTGLPGSAPGSMHGDLMGGNMGGGMNMNMGMGMGMGMPMQPPSDFNTMGSNSLMDTQMSSVRPSIEHQGSFGMGGAPSEPTSEQLPEITAEHLTYYERMFAQLDPTGKGIITQDEAKDIFGRSGLPNEILFQIWMFCDSGDKGCLDKPEFMLALHLIASSKKRIPLPEKLPLKYERFLKDAKRTQPTKDYLLEKVRQSVQENQALMGELGEQPQPVVHHHQEVYHEPVVSHYEAPITQIPDSNYGHTHVNAPAIQIQSAGQVDGLSRSIEEHYRELVTVVGNIKDTNNRVLKEKQDDVHKLNVILMNCQAMLTKLKSENEFIETQLMGGPGAAVPSRLSSMGQPGVDFGKEFDNFGNNAGNDFNF